ncbi:MAG: bacterial Ig-like domain-containing protein [Clostridia bacterium]|nr:bacterial Ig-like domain-containing protein [Clostridia bacterium]
MKKQKVENSTKKKGFFKKSLALALVAGTLAVSSVGLVGCSDGKDGKNGSTWFSGQDAPFESTGKIGDYYFDTDDFNIYKKGETGWVIISNIKGEQGNPAVPPTVEIDANGYWVINGIPTEHLAHGKDGAKWLFGNNVPTTEGVVGDFYLRGETCDIYEKIETGWVKIGNIKGSGTVQETDSKAIGDHTMISDGLTEMAANAVEFVVDDNTGIAYAVYLASETSLGESSALVKMAKFNILQPTNVEWVTVFNKSTDFGGSSLSECNIINLNSSTVRVYAINKNGWGYYYKDVNKKTLALGAKTEVKFKSSEASDPVALNIANLNTYISSIGGKSFGELQMTTKIIEVDGYYYANLVGGNGTQNVLFVKSSDGATWTLQSVIRHSANYEAMLEYHDGKFWVMCRNGVTTPTSSTQQNLMYSTDGITWTQSNLALTTSDTRPYLFRYQGELYLAYSSPMPTNYSTVRNWRCNIHIGKIVSSGGVETFDEVIYKESKFGIVYYALHDWYGNMVMLYSSGELNPTEGLMGGWSQGKDCLNYTVLKTQAPELSFKTLSSISVTNEPNVTEYAVGDTFDPTGLTVRAQFSDNTYSTVTGYTLSTPDMTTAGTKTITVTYTVNGVAKTATFDIEVSQIEKVLQSIEVVSNPTKSNYLLNETFDPSGLVVKANYNIGSPATISNYSLSTPDMSTVGTKTITVSYIEEGVTKTTTFTIEVSEELREYNEFDSLQSSGVQYINTGIKTTANTKIVVRMNKPDNSGVDGGKWLFSSADNSSARNFGFCIKPDGAYVLDFGGTRYQTGTINWQDGVNTITIGNGVFTINDTALVTGLSVTGTPSNSNNTLYFYQSPTSTNNTYLAGIVYEISIYEGDNLVMHLIPAQRTSDNKIGFYDTVGEAFIFSATGTDFAQGPAEVVKVLTEISVVTNPTTTQYVKGDAFDPTGLVVKATYEDGSYKNVTNYSLSTPDMTTAGTKTITVTYQEKGVTQTTSFTITVIDVQKVLDSIEIKTNPTKTTYAINDTFSSNGLVVVANYNVGSPAMVTNYSLSTPDMTTIGTKTVTVSYTEEGVTKTATFEIVVTELNYIQLESVTANGNQYIDTGYTTKANTKIVIEIDKPNDEDVTGGKWLFNSTPSSGNRNFGFNVKPSGAYVLDFGNTRYQTGTINWQNGKNTITIGNGVFTINGGALVTGLNVTATPTTSTGTLWFLTAASSDSTAYFKTNIYKIAVYEGDTLVMNLVPAQSKENGRVGFYDTVADSFVCSSTASDFTSNSSVDIEETYTTLQSVTTDGTGYINTGYTTTANTKVVVTMEKPDNSGVTGGKWLFSSDARNSSTKNFGFCIKENGAYVLDIGGTRYDTGTINWQDGENTITIGNGEFSINDTDLVTGLNITTSSGNSAVPLHIFTTLNTTSTTYFAGTVYEISIYEGDTLAMHLVPSKRGSDGKVGFYDTISEAFFVSSTGTGLTGGAEV